VSDEVVTKTWWLTISESTFLKSVSDHPVGDIKIACTHASYDQNKVNPDNAENQADGFFVQRPRQLTRVSLKFIKFLTDKSTNQSKATVSLVTAVSIDAILAQLFSRYSLHAKIYLHIKHCTSESKM